jgi:hypothetical protein
MKQLFVTFVAFTLGSFCFGQADPMVSLTADKEPIRSVLDKLFTQAGVNYSIDPEVQGEITVTLRDVPLSVALRTILRQARAVYSVEGGIYKVSAQPVVTASEPSQPDEVTPPTPARHRVVKIRVHNMPASYILMKLLGRDTPTPFAFPSVPPQASIFVGTNTPIWYTTTINGRSYGQLYGYVPTGVSLPIWQGSGYEPQLGGFGGSQSGGGPGFGGSQFGGGGGR